MRAAHRKGSVIKRIGGPSLTLLSARHALMNVGTPAWATKNEKGGRRLMCRAASRAPEPHNRQTSMRRCQSRSFCTSRILSLTISDVPATQTPALADARKVDENLTCSAHAAPGACAFQAVTIQAPRTSKMWGTSLLPLLREPDAHRRDAAQCWRQLWQWAPWPRDTEVPTRTTWRLTLPPSRMAGALLSRWEAIANMWRAVWHRQPCMRQAFGRHGGRAHAPAQDRHLQQRRHNLRVMLAAGRSPFSTGTGPNAPQSWRQGAPMSANHPTPNRKRSEQQRPQHCGFEAL